MKSYSYHVCITMDDLKGDNLILDELDRDSKITDTIVKSLIKQFPERVCIRINPVAYQDTFIYSTQKEE